MPRNSSAARRRTFQSALEQAEQQFRAAESIGYDSRALNLFYGLSQAGRAIAAAASRLDGSEWELSGHGLRCIRPEAFSRSVAGFTIQTGGKAGNSFRQVSEAMRSHIPESLTVGQAWPLVVETAMHAPLGDQRYTPMHVLLDSAVGLHGMDSAQPTFPQAIQAIPIEQRPPLDDFLARYPSLRGYEALTPLGEAITWTAGDDNSIRLRWKLSEADPQGQHFLHDRLIKYRGVSMAFPTIEGQTELMHPLMAWWVILFALSIVTRYQPADWTKAIDIDSSEVATTIEYVLDTAIGAIPDCKI